MSAPLKACINCGNTFIAVDWIPNRVDGFCSINCATSSNLSVSAKSWAVRQGILLHSENKKLDAAAINLIEVDK
jgi:hypothetical protein